MLIAVNAELYRMHLSGRRGAFHDSLTSCQCHCTVWLRIGVLNSLLEAVVCLQILGGAQCLIMSSELISFGYFAVQDS